jgi:hypothetical protein
MTGVAVAGLWLVAAPPVAVALHGGAGLAVVVEGERLAAGADGSGCTMAGTVRNPNAVIVTVRMAWRGTDAAGTTLGLATARISRVRPGERRPFASSPFVALGTGQIVAACASMPRVERVEASGDPLP